MPAQPSSRRNSILIAAAVAIALVVWIASGLGGPAPAVSETADAAAEAGMEVGVRQSKARTLRRTIAASARTEPNRTVELKAETEGRIVAIGAERGSRVSTGETIVNIDMRDRQATLAETEALIRQRELEFEAAERLRAQGFMSEAELAAAESLLVSARTARERVQLDIQRTEIRAPFDALVYDRLVEIGDYIGIGDPIAQLVDTDPMIVAGNINQRDIAGVASGSEGTAILNGFGEVRGTVRYLAPVADESTRTFLVELSVPNPDGKFRLGTSAELILGAEDITAHSISSGLLILDAAERIGVMTVDGNERARFMPIELAGSAVDGSVLVTGLPDSVTLITVGQGFVTDGQPVVAVEESRADQPAL